LNCWILYQWDLGQVTPSILSYLSVKIKKGRTPVPLVSKLGSNVVPMFQWAKLSLIVRTDENNRKFVHQYMLCHLRLIRTLRGSPTAGKQLGQNVEAQSQLGVKNNYAKVFPHLEKVSILTMTHIKMKVLQQQSLDWKLWGCCLQPLSPILYTCSNIKRTLESIFGLALWMTPAVAEHGVVKEPQELTPVWWRTGEV
jgi:hypothetical protein